MASKILTQIQSLINLGSTLETAVEATVPGADVNFWQRQVDRAKQAKPKAKKQNKRTTSRKPSKRSNYAKMQSALAMSTLELVERVNGSEPRFINGKLEVF